MEWIGLSRVAGGNGTRDSSDLGKLTGGGQMQFPRVRFHSRGSRSIPQDVWREADGQTVRRLGFAMDRRAEWDEAPRLEERLSGTLL